MADQGANDKWPLFPSPAIDFGSRGLCVIWQPIGLAWANATRRCSERVVCNGHYQTSGSWLDNASSWRNVSLTSEVTMSCHKKEKRVDVV